MIQYTASVKILSKYILAYQYRIIVTDEILEPTKKRQCVTHTGHLILMFVSQSPHNSWISVIILLTLSLLSLSERSCLI